MSCPDISSLVILLSAFLLQNVYSQCLNPNQRYGYCISLYECPPLLSVIAKKPLTETDKNYLRQTECFDGFGRPPLVCCNDDMGFDSQLVSSRNSFPKPFTFPRDNDISFRTSSTSKNIPRPPACGIDSVEYKIYSGSNAHLDEFPWMVLLVYTRNGDGSVSLNCAGSLINERYVLTAAHCVTGVVKTRVGELKYVRLGEHDTSKNIDCYNSICADPVLQVPIEEVIPHDEFHDGSTNRHNDIALIRLGRSVQYSDFIRPICLPFTLNAKPPIPGEEIIVAGWGRTLNSRRATIKQKLSVPVADQNVCVQKFSAKKVNIIESQICAGGKAFEDSCDGDSGGPLMRLYSNSWVLEGIVSFGIRCGFNDWPAVHTRVSSYEKWIKSNIR